ncbi:MAG: hypothetical protein C3F11_03660 [Methylocystaceae bacterium]|nr:MAG: hypothetical protein C3F11_03660 [Methylocystaceae bacterium]
MSAARKLIEAVAERGGRLYVAETGKVKVEASAPLPADLVETLRAHRDELARELAPPAPTFDLERLQREADRKNIEATGKGSTDRWCSCGRLATFAYPSARGRNVWRCIECTPTEGKA